MALFEFNESFNAFRSESPSHNKILCNPNVLFISSAKFADQIVNDTTHVGYGFDTNRIVNVYTAFLKILENIAIFLTATDLETWLNKMTALEREFNAHFHRIHIHLAVDISKDIKRLLVGYFFVPTMLWLVSMYAAFTLLNKSYKSSMLCD